MWILSSSSCKRVSHSREKLVYFSEAGSIPDDILREVSSVYKTPVSATSLAACIKINSCYIPEKIPRFMCSVSIGCVQLILSNHFNTSENGTYFFTVMLQSY